MHEYRVRFLICVAIQLIGTEASQQICTNGTAVLEFCKLLQLTKRHVDICFADRLPVDILRPKFIDMDMSQTVPIEGGVFRRPRRGGRHLPWGGQTLQLSGS